MAMDYGKLFALAPHEIAAPRVDLYTPLAGIAGEIRAGREALRDQANRDRARADAQAARSEAAGRADREFAFRQAEAERAQRNADRSFGLQERTITEGRLPGGFQRTEDGGLRAIPGGPEDPEYLRLRSEVIGKVPTEVQQRRDAVIAQKLDPNSPQMQSYILSGRMPREDQQPLTATDKKAIMEADEGVMSAETAISNLNKAKELSRGSYSGPFAGMRGKVGSLLGTAGGEETSNLDNLVMANALSQLKSTFGAAPTEGERKILLDIQGSVSQPDSVRQAIYDRAIALANKRLEFNRRQAGELRGGTYYKIGGGGSAASGTPAPSAAPALPPPPPGFQIVR